MIFLYKWVYLQTTTRLFALSVLLVLERFDSRRGFIENRRNAIISGFYLGFIVWGRSPEWAKATSFLGGPRAYHPGNFLKWICADMQIFCILRHNFEKWYSVCTDLVTSWWFFWCSYLYTVMRTIFFGGRLGILGKKLLPLKYPR